MQSDQKIPSHTSLFDNLNDRLCNTRQSGTISNSAEQGKSECKSLYGAFGKSTPY